LNDLHLELTTLHSKNLGAERLFLGEWCLKNFKEWEINKDAIVPYHWDDRNKLYKDQQYLSSVYKFFLKEISRNLNLIHKKKHSYRYWEIIIGPWLNYFIPVVFDRWTMLKTAFDQNKVTSYSFIEGRNASLLPEDINEFHENLFNQTWNQVLYQTIIKEFFSKNSSSNLIEIADLTRKKKIKRTLIAFRYLIKFFIEKIGSLVNRKDVFIYSFNIPVLENIKLHFKLRQVPIFWNKQKINFNKGSNDKNRKTLVNFSTKDDFQEVVKFLLPKMIPSIYVEGYETANKYISKLSWPSRPKKILTSDAYAFDEVFKFWAAQKVENTSKLLICQHGGHYGIGEFNWEEDHEISVSDKYITWGWSDIKNKKIIPLGLVNKFINKVSYSRNAGKLLIVTTNFPRLSYRLYSIPIAGQWRKYFNFQIKMINSLDSKIFDNLYLRNDVNDYGRKEAESWKGALPNIKIDNNSQSMRSIYKDTRLVVHTYNGTSFLESLYLDIPTIIYFDTNFWELRNSARDLFEELKDAGIFFDDPSLASSHINFIWKDVEAWWRSKKVREARKNFCNEFAKEDSKYLDKLVGILNQNATS